MYQLHHHLTTGQFGVNYSCPQYLLEQGQNLICGPSSFKKRCQYNVNTIVAIYGVNSMKCNQCHFDDVYWVEPKGFRWNILVLR